ncbi:DUF4190 domain-containing protein [Rossellomorea aquimaris]|uniref:DUF4190 domain-containing protein n=1 Tax=Rossellomorea aquimaris TaxID=189382 RepID=UPI0007D09AB6|nr:DUF4190 domain-containing protein [Rossellomorea aquimaris]
MTKNSVKLPRNGFCKWGFIVGIISVFFSIFLFIPFLGLILSIIGLGKYDPQNESGRWMGITGIILNTLYIFAGMYANGMIG